MSEEVIRLERVLLERFALLYDNELLADVTFEVKGRRFNGHRSVLANHSEYFRGLLMGEFREGHEQVVKVNDMSPDAFEIVFTFIYKAEIPVKRLETDAQLAVSVLSYAHLAQIFDLVNNLIEHLEVKFSTAYILSNLTVTNVCPLLEVARTLKDLPPTQSAMIALMNAALTFIDDHPSEILADDGLLLTQNVETIKAIVERETFRPKEVDVLNAVKKWMEKHPKAAGVTDLPMVVRLERFSFEELVTTVKESGFYNLHLILDALERHSTTIKLLQIPQVKRLAQLVHEGFKLAESNVATTVMGARVMKGVDGNNLIDGSNGKWAYHKIKDGGIVVQLAEHFIVNHIGISVYDFDNSGCAYYVEVSRDNENWTRVVDRTRGYLTSEYHELSFGVEVVKFIRIVGTRGNDRWSLPVSRGVWDGKFYVRGLECFYK